MLRAIRGARLEEILSEAGRVLPARAGAAALRVEAPASRIARRSPQEIAAVIDQIVRELQQATNGPRSEDLQKVLGLHKAIARPIVEALAAKGIREAGAKRSTKHFVRSCAPKALGAHPARAIRGPLGRRCGTRDRRRTTRTRSTGVARPFFSSPQIRVVFDVTSK